MFCFTLALEEEQENKLEELYNRNHLDLIRFAHSIVKSTEEAEDIVQEAFIRIFRNIAKIERLDRIGGSKKFHADYSAPLMLYPFGA